MAFRAFASRVRRTDRQMSTRGSAGLATRRYWQEDMHVLDERQTLRLLGWTLGTVCIGVLLLSAIALP